MIFILLFFDFRWKLNDFRIDWFINQKLFLDHVLVCMITYSYYTNLGGAATVRNIFWKQIFWFTIQLDLT